MSLKATVMVALAAVLVVAAGGHVGRAVPNTYPASDAQMAGMDQTSEQVQAAKALVAEADRLHKAGDHYGSLATVQAARAALNRWTTVTPGVSFVRQRMVEAMVGHRLRGRGCPMRDRHAQEDQDAPCMAVPAR